MQQCLWLYFDLGLPVVLLVIGGGCPKQWKPLDTGGTQPPTSDAAVNSVKELFPFKSTRNLYDKVFLFPSYWLSNYNRFSLSLL